MSKRLRTRPNIVSAIPDPVTFRLPRVGTQDQFFGLPRTGWNQVLLGDNPPIKSIVHKKPGTRRGIRLIVFQSAKEYFTALATQQDTAEESR